MEDEKTQSAVVRQLEIIGEALGEVGDALRRAHPEVPWSKAIGMRNALIHAYFHVDAETVWRTVREDLPSLATQVAALLTDLDEMAPPQPAPPDAQTEG